ncbi:MAG TPA: ATP-binding cassette domain-containing protein [Bacteroidia bacterium]|nr:ATP-binding cassette domain-containing protein [Bacteroidia bacterium]
MLMLNKIAAGYNGEVVLEDITASFSENGIHGLIGLNGSGKTTLMRVIYGLHKVYSGSVKFRNSGTNGQVAFLETENYFYHSITGPEYLSLLNNHKGFDFSPWMRLFNLPAKGFIEEYSSGMKKKLALIGVVCSGKPLLLLDEPFNGLDMESVRILTQVLKLLRAKGKTILITSHILSSMTEVCDTLTIIRNGRVTKSFDFVDAVEIEEQVYRELDNQIQQQIETLTIV